MIDPMQGDRIELIRMPDDPLPIEPGSLGTVMNVGRHNLGDGERLHVDVLWDSGRRLSLVSPPDLFRVLP